MRENNARRLPRAVFVHLEVRFHCPDSTPKSVSWQPTRSHFLASGLRNFVEFGLITVGERKCPTCDPPAAGGVTPPSALRPPPLQSVEPSAVGLRGSGLRPAPHAHPRPRGGALHHGAQAAHCFDGLGSLDDTFWVCASTVTANLNL